jgi:hypothetical protein
MPNNVTINQDLYDFLKMKNFRPEGVKFGKKSVTPEQATGFNFTFKKGRKQYGTAHVAIDNLKKMTVFYNKSAIEEVSSAWLDFVKELRMWGNEHGLKGFKLDTLDNLNDYMERRNYNENLNEGYYGTRNTSYSDKTPPTVKLIIKHNKSLEETDQRYRYVDKIFVENAEGERFLLPTKKPSVGYVYARLIAEGGNPYDERGKHIAQLSEDIAKLGGFIRATKNKQFNEGVDTVIYEAAQKYLELRETMKKMRSSRGFRNYFENWAPTLMEDQDTDDLVEMFANRALDPRIESALPVLNKYNISTQQIVEAEDVMIATNELDEDLEPNMEGQIEELVKLLGDDSEELSLGPDATNAIGIIQDYIQDDSLFQRLRKAAKADPDNDAKPVIIGWMSENIDSDSSYEEVLDQIEQKEPDSAEPTDLPATPPATNPEPVAPSGNSTSNEAPPLGSAPGEMPPGEMPDQEQNAAPPLKEDELERIKRLTGIKGH